MKLLPLAPLYLACACLGVALALPRPATQGIPASSHLVWRVDTDRIWASACPVRTLKDGTVLLLTVKHALRGMSEGFVESRDQQRKFKIISHILHPTADLAAIVVEGDGKPLAMFTLNLEGCGIGERVYTSGFPGPSLEWFGYEGFMAGIVGRHSAIVEQGMSGGALVNAQGNLVGILQGHAVRRDVAGRISRHLSNQALSVMLHLHQDWLRKVKVIE